MAIEYYSDFQRNLVLMSVTWMNLEDIIPNQSGQLQRSHISQLLLYEISRRPENKHPRRVKTQIISIPEKQTENAYIMRVPLG